MTAIEQRVAREGVKALADLATWRSDQAKPEPFPEYEAFVRLLYARGALGVPIPPRSKAARYAKGQAPWTPGVERTRMNTVTLDQALASLPNKGTRNYGIVPGERNVVVDVDDPERLLPTLQAIGLQHILAIVRGAGGGLHVYSKLPPGADPVGSLNGTSRFGRGVDIRGWNGYVVAPGSYVVDAKYITDDNPDGASWHRLEYFDPRAEDLPIAQVEHWYVRPGVEQSKPPEAPVTVLPDDPDLPSMPANTFTLKFAFPPHWGVEAEGGWQLPAGYKNRRPLLYRTAFRFGYQNKMEQSGGMRFLYEVAKRCFRLDDVDDRFIREQIVNGWRGGMKKFRADNPQLQFSKAVPVYVPERLDGERDRIEELDRRFQELGCELLFDETSDSLYVANLPGPVPENAMLGRWQWFTLAMRSGGISYLLSRLDEHTVLMRDVVLELGEGEEGEQDMVRLAERRRGEKIRALNAEPNHAPLKILAQRHSGQIVRDVFFDNPEYFPPGWREKAEQAGLAPFRNLAKLYGQADETPPGFTMSDLDWATYALGMHYCNTYLRILYPGAQAYDIAVLIGPGGTGKSAFAPGMWPTEPMRNRFHRRVTRLNADKMDDETRLWRTFSGAIGLTLDEVKLKEEEIPVFMSFLAGTDDDTRALYTDGAKVRRGWMLVLTQQEAGHLPDAGHGSTRRYNVIRVVPTFPGNPTASGKHFWRQYVTYGLNVLCWQAARVNLEYPDGTPKVDGGLVALDAKGKPLDVKRGENGLPDYASAYPGPVPLVLYKENALYTREQDLRARDVSSRRETYRTLWDAREIFMNEENRTRDDITLASPQPFIPTEVIMSVVPVGTPDEIITSLAEECGWIRRQRKLPRQPDGKQLKASGFIPRSRPGPTGV